MQHHGISWGRQRNVCYKLQVSQDLHLDIEIQLCEHFLKAVTLTSMNLAFYAEAHIFFETQMNEIVSKKSATLKLLVKQDTVLATSTAQTNPGRLVSS